MQIICKDRLRQLKLERDPSLAAQQGQSSNATVEADIARLLEGKSFEQLTALETTVRGKLTSGEPIDVDYWEGLLRSLETWKAKVREISEGFLEMTSGRLIGSVPLSNPFQSRLHQIHLVVIQNRLEQLRHRQREQALKVQEELGGTLANEGTTSGVYGGDMRAEAVEEDAEEEEVAEEVGEPYDREMSPELLEPKKLPFEDRALPIVNEEDDLRALVSEMMVICPRRANCDATR